MNKLDPVLFELQKLTNDLTKIERHHYIASETRHENDIEHSFTVALLAWYICSRYKLPLDLTKVLKYALTHDFVERYAGDVSTFASKAARNQKVKLEKIALQRLTSELVQFADLCKSLSAYDEFEDEESLFVWTVDKMQPYIMGDMDDWRPYKNEKISYEMFIGKHKEQLAACSPYGKQVFEGILEYVETTYYDRP